MSHNKNVSEVKATGISYAPVILNDSFFFNTPTVAWRSTCVITKQQPDQCLVLSRELALKEEANSPITAVLQAATVQLPQYVMGGHKCLALALVKSGTQSNRVLWTRRAQGVHLLQWPRALDGR